MVSSLFRTIILLGVIILGFLWLFQAGLLPQNVYSPLYGFLDALPFTEHADDPALQKFEGHWMLTFSAEASSSPLGTCLNFTTVVAAHDGMFMGHVTIPGYLISIEASTTENGAVSGKLSSTLSDTGAYGGAFSGAISGASGSGSWQDTFQCRGTWQLKKTAPVVDPTQARIISVDGLVTITRDGNRLYAEPQENLYAGDVVQTPTGGDATLEEGSGEELVTIPENTTYTVPDAGGLEAQ